MPRRASIAASNAEATPASTPLSRIAHGTPIVGLRNGSAAAASRAGTAEAADVASLGSGPATACSRAAASATVSPNGPI